MARYFSLWVAVTVFLAISVFTRTSAGADDFNHDRPPQISCADLANFKLPDTRITSVQEMEAGPFPFGNVAPTCSSDIASPQLPAFCRVQGTIGPGQINFEVWLPLEGWNGKFQGLGNHGFAGNIEYSDMGPELVKGYAVAGTDSGHQGNATAWMQ